jgi:hypothetical protein
MITLLIARPPASFAVVAADFLRPGTSCGDAGAAATPKRVTAAAMFVP